LKSANAGYFKMVEQPILSEYITRAMAYAEYDKPEDGTFCGRIPPGVRGIAFADSLPQCQYELRSLLEDCLLFGFKMNHRLPVIDAINLY